MELETLDGQLVEQILLDDDSSIRNDANFSPYPKLPFLWIPRDDKIISENFPIVSIPLLAEISFYTGNRYWNKTIHPLSEKIRQKIEEHFKLHPVDKPYSKTEVIELNEVIEEKKRIMQEPDEKRSSLLGNLETLCINAFEVHKGYINALITGDEASDYIKKENEIKYVDDFIPRSAETIAITMSDLIHSDGHKPSAYTDRRTKESYEKIYENILNTDGKKRVTEFVKLFSIGLAVIKEKQKKKNLKIISPRKHSNTPMIFNDMGQVNLSAETNSGES